MPRWTRAGKGSTDAREQYAWIRKAGNFKAVLAQRDDTFELDDLQPGDLLFWASNFGVSRDPEIIQREIEQTREALAGTLDRLAERYSPKAVADRGRRMVLAKLQSPVGMAAVGLTAGLVLFVVVRRIRHR